MSQALFPTFCVSGFGDVECGLTERIFTFVVVPDVLMLLILVIFHSIFNIIWVFGSSLILYLMGASKLIMFYYIYRIY